MNANVEDRGIKGDCTPLMEAASAGHVDIVSLLIAHGADVNAQSTSGKICCSYIFLILYSLRSSLKSIMY
jgi:ankyrin repeat domain-containing protein 17